MAVYDEETRKTLQSRKRRAEMKRAQQVKMRNTVFLGVGVLVLLILFIVLVSSSCSSKKDKKIEVVTTQQATTAKAVETTTEEATTATTVMYTTDVLNLRTEPNTDCEIIKQIAEGKKVEILEDQGEWCKVKQGKDTGYVSKQYLTDKKGNKNDSAEETTAKEEEAGDTEEE